VTGPVQHPYAGPVSRAVAFVVDVVVVAVVAVGSVLFVEMLGAVLGSQVRTVARVVVSTTAVVLPALLVVYCLAFWALAGRTPGMALLGVRVVSTAGRPVSWLSSLIRAVVLVVFPIGWLWSLVDRRSQGIHDKLARTTVVRPELSRAPARPRTEDAAQVR
jgi:uncharacterized RDD family membrane protein YckC